MWHFKIITRNLRKITKYSSVYDKKDVIIMILICKLFLTSKMSNLNAVFALFFWHVLLLRFGGHLCFHSLNEWRCVPRIVNSAYSPDEITANSVCVCIESMSTPFEGGPTTRACSSCVYKQTYTLLQLERWNWAFWHPVPRTGLLNIGYRGMKFCAEAAPRLATESIDCFGVWTSLLQCEAPFLKNLIGREDI